MGTTEVSIGEYELEEPWGRLVEVGRATETVDVDLPDAVTTYALKDRTFRTSSIKCKTIAEGVTLGRFLDAHLAELRRFLLEQAEGEHARLRALDVDVLGRTCRVEWSFSVGDADPRASTNRAVGGLHDGFLARLAPVPIEEARLEPRLGGGIDVLAACGDKTTRSTNQSPSGPGYRDVQLTTVRDWPRIERWRQR